MHGRRQIVILAALVGLASLVQMGVIRRARTTALDAVRFVTVAQQIDREGVAATIHTQREQSLFPVWIWVVQEGLLWTGGQRPTLWAEAAQLAAAVPLVLAVIPVFLLSRRLAGLKAAIAATFFFCLLPEVTRLGADGISDSMHLLFLAVALWGMVEYLNGRTTAGRLRAKGWLGSSAAPPPHRPHPRKRGV